MSEVSLREFFEEKITALEQRLEVERSSDRRALELQAQEYERRLKGLNNEHARVDKIVADKVDRKEWDDHHRQLAADFSVLKEQIAIERARAIGETEAKAKA